MKIEKIHIKEFRHMIDLEVKFGNNLTCISGQNGTGKSSILGLVGQIFDYKGKEKTKNNLSFKAKFSEIFKFCPQHEYNANHEYLAIISDNNDNKIVKEAKSRFSAGEGKYGRFRIDVGDRTMPGSGAIDFPVIYLGLKRLYPLAQEKEGSIKIKTLKLKRSEKKFYNKHAKEILILLDRNIQPQDIRSPNKEFLAVETPDYSNLGNSAGEDNIGQILTAILSFRKLKEINGENYKGGILLIDEVDATLYAGSQINLLTSLYKFSFDYNLQIIFTTHSLEALKFLREKTRWDTQINFFELVDGKVKNVLNRSLGYIRNSILVQTKQTEKIEKFHVLCEDKITESWCKNLLNGTDIKKNVSIQEVPMGAGTLKTIAQKNCPAFKKMIFVLDGDCRNKPDFQKMPRTLFLPGVFCPEKIFYEYLKSLQDEDEFWDYESHYVKQVCFRDFIDIHTKNEFKNWFTINKKNLGRTYSKLFNRWKKDNKGKVKEFKEDFKKILSTIKT